MDEIEIDLTFAPKDRELGTQEALDVLQAAGAREIRPEEDYGLVDAGLTVFAIISVAALVNAVIKLSQLWAKCIVIDTRGKKVRVTTSSDGPLGSVITISQGNVRVVVERPTEMSFPQLLRRLLKEAGHIRDSAS